MSSSVLGCRSRSIFSRYMGAGARTATPYSTTTTAAPTVVAQPVSPWISLFVMASSSTATEPQRVPPPQPPAVPELPHVSSLCCLLTLSALRHVLTLLCRADAQCRGRRRHQGRPGRAGGAEHRGDGRGGGRRHGKARHAGLDRRAHPLCAPSPASPPLPRPHPADLCSTPPASAAAMPAPG